MKIKYKDAAYILGYKQKHFVKKWLSNWTLEEANYEGHIIRGRFKLFWYVLLFIPTAIIAVGYSLWDGGLKTIGDQLLPYELVSFRLAKYDCSNQRALDVIEKYGGTGGRNEECEKDER